MRVYLNRNYGEVCAGSPKIHQVMVDENNPNRFFILAGETERDTLATLGMLEGEGDADPNTIPLPAPTPDAEKEFLPKPSKAPESYLCKTHKREHRMGSSAYVACYEANFGKEKEQSG